MADIRIRRGTQAQLPTLNIAEPGFTTDTKRLYIGDGVGNIFIGPTTFSGIHIERFSAGDLQEGETGVPGIGTAGPVTGRLFDADQNESLYGHFRVKENIKDSTNITVNAYWMNDDSQTGTNSCVWVLRYHVYSDEETYGSKTTTTLSATDAMPNNASAGIFKLTNIGSMVYNNGNNPFSAGDIISFRILRFATDGSDTLTGDAALLLLTFEYEVE